MTLLAPPTPFEEASNWLVIAGRSMNTGLSAYRIRTMLSRTSWSAVRSYAWL